MSDTYTKLFSSITESTVWGEPYATRIVWVTLLAMADARGDAYGSTPGLARRANVTLEEVDAALESFRQPDPRSRTQDNQGRRIEDIDGGWHLLNHDKYAAIRNEAERREYKRDWDRQHRPSGHARQSDTQSDSPTKVRQGPSNPTAPTTPALTPTLALEKKKNTRAKSKKPQSFPLPDDFSISERVAKWAAAKGYDRLPDHLEAFKQKALAKGYVYANWDEAFMGAIRSDWAELRSKGTMPQAGSGAHRMYVPENRPKRAPSAGAPAEFAAIASKLGLKAA